MFFELMFIELKVFKVCPIFSTSENVFVCISLKKNPFNSVGYLWGIIIITKVICSHNNNKKSLINF